MKYEIDYSNIENINVEFSTALRDSYGIDAQKAIILAAKAMSTSYNYVQKQVSKGEKIDDTVSDWKQNGLDATNTQIIGGSDYQNQIWDSHGLLLRKYDNIENKYEDNQMKIVNSTIAITNDNWETVKTAIGYYFYTDNNDELKSTYGINAETIVGKLVLGNELYFSNETNTMTFDQNGLTVSNGTNTFIVNPGDVNLLKIKKGEEDVFYVDQDGKLHITGDGTYIDVSSNEVIEGIKTDILSLQKTSHTHENKSILDKIEQPYTTAERDKLAGLENYTHHTYTAHAKGFYKFASDGEGHVAEAEKVTKEDITALGIPSENTDTTYTISRETIYDDFLTLTDKTGKKSTANINPIVTPTSPPASGALAVKIFNSGLLYSVVNGNPNQGQHEKLYCIRDIEIDDNHTFGSSVRFNILGFRKVFEMCDTGEFRVFETEDLSGIYRKFKFPKKGGTLAVADDIPDISGKQDKLTAGTNITINGNTINAKDTTYGDATQSAHGLMTAADKKKLDGMDLSKYLPLAGGVMTGNIDLAASKVDLLVGSQPATQSTTTTAVAGGSVSAKLSFGVGLPARKSIVGTWLDENNVLHDIISVRYRNGHGDGTNYGMYLRSLLTSNGNLIWNKQTKADTWQGERVLLDSSNYTNYAAKSDHTHDAITNSSRWASGANNAAQWVRLGTVVSSGNFATTVISVWSGDGANGNASQNSWFDIHIKDGWQSTESATKACGVTVYRTRCGTVKVKVIPTAHNTYTVWVYLPWTYWNGNYSVHGKYSSWTPQVLKQTAEPDGTAADTAYYDQAFLTSTVAKAKEADTLIDSGWQKPTFPSGVKSSSIRYRKQGKIVSVTGYVQFSAAQTTITVLTLPTGYRPPAKIQQFNAVDSSAQQSFLIKIDTDGKVGFFGKTQGFFTTTAEYYIHCTFFVD